MLKEIDNHLSDIKKISIKSSDELEEFRIKYISKKGIVTGLFSRLKDVDSDKRKKFGLKINELKIKVGQIIDKSKAKLSSLSKKESKTDYSLPADFLKLGSRHPISIVKNKIIDIFSKIGFDISEGPEIEDDWHNFTALNLPEYHPARDMQDTFFINKDIVLRTHTSNVQIHLMEVNEPPLRFIVPGRVYRNEAISYKSYCLFHQVEGLYVDKNVSFGQLKGCLEYFVKKMFGEKCKMRWRPSYFPFTEPSAEVDIWDDQRKQWMEILGCGMVDPDVFNNVGYDSKIWHGYAFGMGVERIAMLKHNIDDIRLFYSGDIRFLRQFK